MIKKADVMLIIFFMFIAIGLILILNHLGGSNDQVVISVNGNVIQTISLTKDGTYKILEDQAHNEIQIENGRVKMTQANCPDHLCERQTPISHIHESIVCLPNKVVVEIKSDKKQNAEPEVDSISR